MEWQKQGHKQLLEHVIALPQLLLAKSSPALTAEEHHQRSLYVLAWVADHMALPYLRTLHKTKGHLLPISLENARDLLMSSVLVMYTLNDFDRIHGNPVVSWLTAPTYALVVPDNAQPLHPAPIDCLRHWHHNSIRTMEWIVSWMPVCYVFALCDLNLAWVLGRLIKIV